MATLNHPWQYGPSELIKHAIEHMHRDSDFDRRIAFLLLDVGVETLLKTFLTLPETVTHTTIKFQERKTAAEGSFHAVIEGIKKAVQPGKLLSINMADVEFYHSKRNTLYHDGNGITIPADLVEKYALLAVDLLNRLLDVDLSSELNRPRLLKEIEKKSQEQRVEMRGMLNKAENALKNFYKNSILLVAEHLAPQMVFPSFRQKLKNIDDKYLEKYITDVDEKGVETYFVRAEHPDVYLHEVLDLVNSSISDDQIRHKLFDDKTEGGFISKIEYFVGQNGFVDDEDLIFALFEFGSGERIPLMPEFFTSSLHFILSNDDFDNDDERYTEFIQEYEKVMSNVQKAEDKIKHWLDRYQVN